MVTKHATKFAAFNALHHAVQPLQLAVAALQAACM
jgi:hypothetical protein